MPTQLELAQNAMFTKAENLANRVTFWQQHRYLLNADGSRYYRVEKDKLGTPYAVYRDVTAYVQR